MCQLSAVNRGGLLAGVSGTVSVNGQPLTAVTMQRLCGYVLQDDVLPGTSTVEEYLRYVFAQGQCLVPGCHSCMYC